MRSNLRGTAGSNVEVNKAQTETNEANTNRERQVQTEMNVGEVAKRPYLLRTRYKKEKVGC